jgi:hypothetical protein
MFDRHLSSAAPASAPATELLRASARAHRAAAFSGLPCLLLRLALVAAAALLWLLPTLS